jgi:hypothetical protein
LVAYLALFVALGGTSYAAGSKLLPRNSVGSAQVINRSLLAGDFKKGQLPRGAPGTRGVDGARGADGSPGAQGPAGTSGAPGSQGAKGATGATGPATGPAGGDLTGNYPDPQLRSGAVTPAEVGTIPAARVGLPRGFVADNCLNSIPASSDTVVFWQTEDFDLSAMHPGTQCPAADPTGTRLTAPIAGIYDIDAGIVWANGGAGERFLGLRANGSTYVARSRIPAALSGNGTSQTISTLVSLQQNQYVEAVLFQDSGGSLPIDGFFAMHWIGPAS